MPPWFLGAVARRQNSAFPSSALKQFLIQWRVRRVADEAKAADDFAHTVLEAGQAQVLHLRPVARDVAKVFGVGLQLAKERSLGFEGTQAAFGVVLLFAKPHELMSAQDALEVADAGGQSELDFEPLGAEAGAAA